MTVTSLDPRRRCRPRSAIVRPPHGAGLRLSFEVTVGGEHPYADAVAFIEKLRGLTDEVGTARLEVSPGPGAAELGGTSLGADATGLGAGHRIVVRSASRDVLLDGVPIALTRIEFDLLHFLGRNPRRVFNRPQLLQSVWGYSQAGDRTVDVHIRRIRAKLGDAPLVTTVRGVGYRLADEADVAVSA